MAITGGSLADGQLPNTKTTLYTVPGSTIAHITHVVLVNTSGGAITVNIYVKRSGSTSRRIIDKDKSIAAGASYWVPISPSALRLSAADVIEGDASSATSVDYVILGGQEA